MMHKIMLLFLFVAVVTHAAQTNAELAVLKESGFIGTISPRSSHEINASTWSIGAETMDRNYTEYSQWRKYLAPLGAKHARVQGGWARCEVTVGVYTWDWLDEIVFDMAVNQSVKPWLQTSYGNPIYSGGGTIEASSPVPSGAAVEPWNNWVAALVTRYSEYVDEWEIWNEPDLNVPVEDYAALLIRTATIIKKIQPSAHIFAQLAGKVSYMEQYLAILNQQGQLGLIDTVTYHPYAYNPDGTYVANGVMQYTLAAIRNVSKTISLYQGENGVANERGGYGAISNWNWTDTTQTKWALRRMLGDFAHGLRSSYFSISNMCYSGTINRKGLLEVDCETLAVTGVKPAYYSYQYLTSLFDQNVIVLETIESKVPSQDYSLYAFRNVTSSTDMVAIWNMANTPLDENIFVNATFSVTGVNIHNPVWVDLRMGTIYQLPASNWNVTNDLYYFIDIPVYDSIVLIADLSALSRWS